MKHKYETKSELKKQCKECFLGSLAGALGKSFSAGSFGGSYSVYSEDDKSRFRDIVEDSIDLIAESYSTEGPRSPGECYWDSAREYEAKGFLADGLADVLKEGGTFIELKGPVAGFVSFVLATALKQPERLTASASVRFLSPPVDLIKYLRDYAKQSKSRMREYKERRKKGI